MSPTPEISIAVEGGTDLAAALRRVPREMRPALRRELKKVGDEALQQARARSSWSTRIPRSLTVAVRFGRSTTGVRLEARRGIAPHARPYQGFGGATFRHPVFGNRNVWVAQATRPFLPTSGELTTRARTGAQRAITAAVRQAGVDT